MDVGSGSGGAGGASSASGSGLAPNVAGALSYVLWIVTGIIFILIEKDNYVRFHAYQSIFFSVAWIVFWIAFSILGLIIGFIPVIGIIWTIISLILSIVLGLGGFILWIVLLIKAYQGERWKLPYIGDIAERYAAQSA